MSVIKKRMNVREVTGIILLAVLLAVCFRSMVNPIADSFLTPTELTIRRADDEPGRNVTILYEEYEHNDNELFLQLKTQNEEENDLWDFTQGVAGESWTMLVDTPECKGITIKTEISPRKYLAFLCNRGGGIAEIKTRNRVITVDCYRDQDNSDILRIYPFEHDKKIVLVKILLYIILFMTFLLTLAILYCLFKRKLYVLAILSEPIEKIDFILCIIIIFGTAVFLYKIIGIPNYLQAGDEMAYWQTTLLDKGDVFEYLATLFAPRGYWCYIPQTVAIYLGKALSCDASIIWMLILSFGWSGFLTIVFPGIYKNLCGKSARRIHLIMMLLVLLTIWRYAITSVLMDIPGMLTFFGSIYYMSSFWGEEGTCRDAIRAGILGAVSCSFRPAHFIGILGFLAYGVVRWFRKKTEEQKKKKLLKKIIHLAAGILAFILICIPQLKINLIRGHVGLLPYDHEHAYYDRSVTVWSSDWALSSGNIAYPLLATDDQMRSMKNQLYGNETPLTMTQLFDVYTNSPVESLMLIAKKLIIGFDQKTNIAFPGDGNVPWRETVGMLFSLWNYFILYSAIFAFTKNKNITRQEKWMAVLIFVLLVLPETFMKIEWRYVMVGYFLIYYFFSFYFAGPILEDKEYRKMVLEKTDYLPGLSVFMFAYLALSFIFLA